MRWAIQYQEEQHYLMDVIQQLNENIAWQLMTYYIIQNLIQCGSYNNDNPYKLYIVNLNITL